MFLSFDVVVNGIVRYWIREVIMEYNGVLVLLKERFMKVMIVMDKVEFMELYKLYMK